MSVIHTTGLTGVDTGSHPEPSSRRVNEEDIDECYMRKSLGGDALDCAYRTWGARARGTCFCDLPLFSPCSFVAVRNTGYSG